jgi:ABC-type glycerol-3-phosphate transport system substrate-binding protein
MEKEFVPYQQALELKELGFDEPCFGKFYHNHLEIGGSWLNSEFNKDKKDGNIFTSAPLYQQVFRWFREKYNAHIYPQKFTENTWHVSWGDWESPVFETYEEAELECVNFLITTLKNKKC